MRKNKIFGYKLNKKIQDLYIEEYNIIERN